MKDQFSVGRGTCGHKVTGPSRCGGVIGGPGTLRGTIDWSGQVSDPSKRTHPFVYCLHVCEVYDKTPGPHASERLV